MSIGDVLGRLRPDFPDITISKIRFLEAEGLVEPQRSTGGYRRFSARDLDRLRFVLTRQRDHYLPLRVIKAQLDAVDRGLQSPMGSGAPHVPERRHDDPGPDPAEFAPALTEMRLSRAELAAASGLAAERLAELERAGLLASRAGGDSYDGDALVIARAVAGLERFGIEPRHLRAFRTAADREVGLVQQVLAPLAHGRDPQARGRAAETAHELAALSVRLHTALVRAGLRPLLDP